MEVPTRKKVSDMLEWRPVYSTSIGSRHHLTTTYPWEGEQWTVAIEPWENGQYVNWALYQDTSKYVSGQCGNVEDAVSACVDAILKRIGEHVEEYQREQEEKRKLEEHNRKADEWADKANNVRIED